MSKLNKNKNLREVYTLYSTQLFALWDFISWGVRYESGMSLLQRMWHFRWLFWDWTRAMNPKSHLLSWVLVRWGFRYLLAVEIIEKIYIYIYCYLFYYFLELWSFFFFHIFHLEVGLLILLYSSVFFFVVSIILDIIFSFPTLFHKWLMILLTYVSFSLFYYVSEDKLNPWTKDHKWNNKQSSCYSRWTWRSVVVCFTVRRRAW